MCKAGFAHDHKPLEGQNASTHLPNNSECREFRYCTASTLPGGSPGKAQLVQQLSALSVHDAFLEIMALFFHPVAKRRISLIIARDHAMTVRSEELCKLLVHFIPLHYLFGRKPRFLALRVAAPKLEIDLHKLLPSLFRQSAVLCTLTLVVYPFMQSLLSPMGTTKSPYFS
jgi:hypothetical protein